VILALSVSIGALIAVLPEEFGIALLIMVLALAIFRLLRVSLVQVCIFLIPWQIYLFNWPGTTFTITVFQILILVAILQTLADRTLHQPAITYGRFVPLVILVFLGALSGFVSGYPKQTLQFLLNWFPPIALFWVIQTNSHKMNLRDVLKILLLSMALQGMLGLVQFFIRSPGTIVAALRTPFARLLFDPDMLTERLWKGDFNWILAGRVYAFGTFLSAVYFSFFTACFGCLSLGLALGDERRSFWRSPYMFSGILLIIASLASYKRTGWVTLAFGLIVLLALSRSSTGVQRRRKGIALFLLAVLLPVALLVIADGTLASRAVDQIGTSGSRLNVWIYYARVLLAHPLLGLGPAFQQESGYALSTFWGGLPATAISTTENMYLNLGLQTGIFGLLAFFWFIFGTLWPLWSARKRHPSNLIAVLLAWFAAYLIGSLFFDNLGTQTTTSFLVVMIWVAQQASAYAFPCEKVTLKQSMPVITQAGAPLDRKVSS
jgi:hypothetical protein